MSVPILTERDLHVLLQELLHAAAGAAVSLRGKRAPSQVHVGMSLIHGGTQLCPKKKSQK
jgi:hypothetical protein